LSLVPKSCLKYDLFVILDKITKRRKRVLSLKLQGKTDYEVAFKLGYSLSTVEKDIHAIRERIQFCEITYSKNFLSENKIVEVL